MGIMPDREKVIKGLEYCMGGCQVSCFKCPYRDIGEIPPDCLDNCRILQDAVELLKEQEAIKPYMDYDGQDVWRCGKCGNSLMHPSYYESDEDQKNHIRYCSHCGRAVKWDD